MVFKWYLLQWLVVMEHLYKRVSVLVNQSHTNVTGVVFDVLIGWVYLRQMCALHITRLVLTIKSPVLWLFHLIWHV